VGRWDDGIFDSDGVLDFVAPIEANLLRTIVFNLADTSLIDEWGDGSPHSNNVSRVLASIEILCLICEHANIRFFVAKHLVRRWREVALEKFEQDLSWDNCQTPDGLDARIERRKVIENTFNRLEALTNE
jgi:hypothetical protein